MSLDTAIITQYYQGILRLTPSASTVAAYAALPSYEAAMAAMENAAVPAVNPIIRLYQAAFDRVPDSAGLTNYTAAYGSGAGTMSLLQIANQWTTTTEFLYNYPTTMPNADYVGLLYYNVLQRQGDAQGIANFTAALNSGLLTRAQVLLEISQSPEMKLLTDGHVQVFQEQCALNDPNAYSGTLYDKNPTNVEYTLTVNPDTATANVFDGSAVFNAYTATWVNTLQTADKLTGAGPNPTLNVTIEGTAAYNATPTLKGVETVNIVDNNEAGFSLHAGNTTGLKRVSVEGTIGTTTVDNIAAVLDNVTVQNITNTAANVTVDYVATAVTGATTQGVTLDNARFTDFAIGDATEGIETINVGVGRTSSVTLLDSDSLVTFTASNLVGGAGGNLTIGTTTGTTAQGGFTEAGTLLTVDASGMTGNFVANIGNAYDNTAAIGNSVNVIGGSGSDIIVSTVGLGAEDELTGGLGVDILQVQSGDGGATTVVANATSVIDGIEVLTVSSRNEATGAQTYTVDASLVGGLNTINVESRSNSAVGTAQSIVLNATELTSDQAGDVNVTLAANTSADVNTATLNLQLADGETTAAAVVDVVVAENGNAVTINDTATAIVGTIMDDVTVNLAGRFDSTVTLGTDDFDVSTTLTGGGAGAVLTVNNVAGRGLTSVLVDASDVVSDLAIELGAEDQEVIGGSGDDNFDFGANFNSNDVLDGGAGANTLTIAPTASVATALDITNIQTLAVASVGANTYNFNGVTGIDTVELLATPGLNDVFTASRLRGITNIVATAGTGGAADDFNGLSITSGFTGAADTLTLELDTTEDDVRVGTLTLAGLENLNIVYTGDATGSVATLTGGIAASGLEQVIVTTDAVVEDAQNIVLGTISNGGAAESQLLFDATAASTGVSVTLADLTDGAEVLGSDYSDILSIAGSSGASIVITTGDGNDIVTLSAADGVTVVTGTGDSDVTLSTGDANEIQFGTGDNNFIIADGTADVSANNLITGFGTGDLVTVRDTDGNDSVITVAAAFVATGVDFTTYEGDTTVFTANAGTNGAICTGVNAPASFAAADIATFLDAIFVGTDGEVGVMAFNDGTDTYIYDVHVATSGAAVDDFTVSLIGTVDSFVATQLNFAVA